MSVDHDDVRKMADLARLRLEPEETERLARELDSILEHMEVLRRVDTSGAEGPEADADGGDPAFGWVRTGDEPPDRLEASLEVMAPAWDQGFFLVPRLPAMEREESAGDDANDAGAPGDSTP